MGIVAVKSERLGNGTVAITDSKGYRVESDNVVDLLKAIAKPYDGDLKVAWDMMKFLKPVWAKLPNDVVNQLTAGGRVLWDIEQGESRFYFRLFYGIGKGKRFGISVKEREHLHGNFYREEKFEADTFEERIYYPDDADPDDLSAMVKMGEELLWVVKKITGSNIQPTTLTSPGAIYKEAVLNKFGIPTIWDFEDKTDDAFEFAANIMREWRQCYKVGYWKEGEIWDYDKSACYPAILAKLPSLNPKYASLTYSSDGSTPEGAYWGVLRGEVTIDADVSPIIFTNDVCYSGTWEDYLTTDDIACIQRHKLGSFKPYEGWFVKISKEYHPFEYMMKRLYELRNGNELQSMMAKLISVQVIGMFQETHENNGELKHGDFYNTIYAAMVTSRARCELCDFVYENHLEKDLVTITVDGCLATKGINLPMASEFGKWRLSPPSEALVINQQFQWYGEKRPAGITVKDILKEIREHPMAKSWGEINLPLIDQTRDFDELPKNGRDLLTHIYTSKPKVA